MLKPIKPSNFSVIVNNSIEEKPNCAKCGGCCTDMDITILELAHPEIFLDETGLELYKAFGLDTVLKNKEKIKILHRCQWLTKNNECGMYDKRPKYCKEWSCRKNLRDAKWVKEKIGEYAQDGMKELITLIFQKQSENQEIPDDIAGIVKRYLSKKESLIGKEII